MFLLCFDSTLKEVVALTSSPAIAALLQSGTAAPSQCGGDNFKACVQHNSIRTSALKSELAKICAMRPGIVPEYKLDLDNSRTSASRFSASSAALTLKNLEYRTNSLIEFDVMKLLRTQGMLMRRSTLT